MAQTSPLPTWSAVCFDFDGTLARYTGNFDDWLDGVRTDLGLLACDFTTFKGRVSAELRAEGHVTLHSALTNVLTALELRVPTDLDEVVQRAVARYAAEIELEEGARSLLEWLAGRGVPMAVLTNGPEDMQRAALSITEVERFFSVVLISGDRDVAVRKPHPRIFDLACTGLATPPERTVMVGDNEEADIDGAAGYGMPAVLVGAGRKGEAVHLTELRTLLAANLEAPDE